MPKSKSEKTKSVKSRRTSRAANYNPIASSVKRLYNKSAPLLICEALLFGVAAILMVIKPVAILTALTLVIGVALVLFGLYRTIAGFVVSRDMGGGWFDVVFGLLTVVLGVLFCIYPVGSVAALVYIFVILFALRAILSLIFSINMIRARFGNYWFDDYVNYTDCAGGIFTVLSYGGRSCYGVLFGHNIIAVRGGGCVYVYRNIKIKKIGK